MVQVNQNISQKLISFLPEDEQYYKLSDLRAMGFPGFVVQRMQVELERNLAESIVPPQTDWANMESERVQQAWDQFVGAIRAEARLPASYAHTIIETAVDDIMDILIRPRQNLPEVIFGASDELNYKEIEQRMDLIVVYRHFTTLIPRYMKRKGIDRLTKARCATLVEKADEKLTTHYSPLNWARMLEPLFTLLDEQIDSNLLRLFFEDKKMLRIARSFDLINKSLNRAQFIEILSSPELLNFEGYDEQGDRSEEDQSSETWRKPFASDPFEDNNDKKKKSRENRSGNDKEEKKDTGKPDAEDDDPILSSFHQSRETAPDDAETLRKKFFPEEETVEDDVYDEEEENKEKISLNQIFFDEKPDNIGEEGPQEESLEKKDEESAEENEDDIMITASDQDGKETPMWQRFMTPEERAEAERMEKQEMEHKTDEEGFIEEPIIDLTKKDEPDESTLNQLNALLNDEKNRFVEEIFSGADQAYEEAVNKIALKQNWRDASKFIEKEVFKRNLVDIYSEVAVDFTDRLQTFFIKKKKEQNQ